MYLKNNLILLVASVFLIVSMIGGIVNSTDPTCVAAPEGQVYLFDSWDFNGERFIYNVSNGYLALPEKYRNNVQSFISGSDVCFVKWYPREQYQVTAGESHRNYAALTNFGQRMDAIIPGNCSNISC